MAVLGINSKNIFDETLERCYALITLFETSKNDDLLRAAIVLAVAGLDKYCKDKFLEHFSSYYNSKDDYLSKRCDEILKKAGLSLAKILKLYRAKEKDPSIKPVEKITQALRKYLYHTTFQNEESIIDLFQAYELQNVIKDAIKKSGKVDTSKNVDNLLKRRNKIAHTADYGDKPCASSLDIKEINVWLQSLLELVECIDAIVSNKFKNKKERKGNKKMRTLVSSLLRSMKAEEFTASYYQKKGYLDVDEASSLRRIKDIEDLFSVKAERRGFLYKGTVLWNGMKNTEIWWPKISSKSNYAGWFNKLNDLDSGETVTIIESNQKNACENENMLNKNCEEDRTRIVFGVIEGDECVVGYCYRFLGVFNLDKGMSRKQNACVWVRESTRLSIS